MLNVLLFGAVGLAQVQQHPPESIALRVVMTVKDEGQVSEIFAAAERDWEAKAAALGFTVVPIERASLAVEKRLWEPVSLTKAIETLKVLQQVPFADIRSMTDLPAPLQRAVLERSNRLIKSADGKAIFDLNSAVTIGAGPEYVLEIDGRTFSTTLATRPKPGESDASAPVGMRWAVNERTLARAEEKKTALTMRISRPISEARYFSVTQYANAALAKRWGELEKTYEDLELAVVESQYGKSRGEIPDAARLALTLDAQNAGFSREAVAARGRFRQKPGNILISLKMPSKGEENSYFGMGVRDLFELP